MRTTNQSMTAPEINRMAAKLAASMPVFLRAILHSNELLANASIASDVSRMVRVYDIKNSPQPINRLWLTDPTQVSARAAAVRPSLPILEPHLLRAIIHRWHSRAREAVRPVPAKLPLHS